MFINEDFFFAVVGIEENEFVAGWRHTTRLFEARLAQAGRAMRGGAGGSRCRSSEQPYIMLIARKRRIRLLQKPVDYNDVSEMVAAAKKWLGKRSLAASGRIFRIFFISTLGGVFRAF